MEFQKIDLEYLLRIGFSNPLRDKLQEELDEFYFTVISMRFMLSMIRVYEHHLRNELEN